jgi:hypothetical protein
MVNLLGVNRIGEMFANLHFDFEIVHKMIQSLTYVPCLSALLSEALGYELTSHHSMVSDRKSRKNRKAE